MWFLYTLIGSMVLSFALLAILYALIRPRAQRQVAREAAERDAKWLVESPFDDRYRIGYLAEIGKLSGHLHAAYHRELLVAMARRGWNPPQEEK